MYFRDFAASIIDARCDILTILNCCNARAADVPDKRPNFNNYVKEVIAGSQKGSYTWWGRASVSLLVFHPLDGQA